MCLCNRRDAIIGAAGAALLLTRPAHADARTFLAEAERMKQQAVAAGDQPYGAVLVFEGRILGYGPSRVVADRNPNAHAERVALWQAQERLGRKEIVGAISYSTSIPCSACQRELAAAKVARMIYGVDAIDGGAPRP
jgi:tRNA(Arg) A34 adenosine deaminase TadA